MKKILIILLLILLCTTISIATEFPTGEVTGDTGSAYTGGGVEYIPETCIEVANKTGVIEWADGFQYQEILVPVTPAKVEKKIKFQNVGNYPIYKGKLILSNELKPYMNATVCDWRGECGTEIQMRENEELFVILEGNFGDTFHEPVDGKIMVLEDCKIHSLNVRITRPPFYSLYRTLAKKTNISEKAARNLIFLIGVAIALALIP